MPASTGQPGIAGQRAAAMPPSVAPDGLGALRHLLASDEDLTRLAAVWGRSPTLLSASEAATRLVTFDDIERWINAGNLRSGQIELVLDGEHPPGGIFGDRNFYGRKRTGYVDPAKVQAGLARGATLELYTIEDWHAGTARLCRTLALSLRAQVHAFVFLSQLGRGGRKVHRDAGHTFVIQLAGSKIWEVFDALPDKDNGTPAPIDKTRVGTGQIYYVPVGSPHRALADSKYSLHVTLSITEPPLRALVTAWAGSFTSAFRQTQWIGGSREQRLAEVQDWTEKMIASLRGHSPEELLDRMENEWIEPKADWISLE